MKAPADIVGALVDIVIVGCATAAMLTGHLNTVSWLAIIGPISGARVALLSIKGTHPASGGSAILLLITSLAFLQHYKRFFT